MSVKQHYYAFSVNLQMCMYRHFNLDLNRVSKLAFLLPRPPFFMPLKSSPCFYPQIFLIAFNEVAKDGRDKRMFSSSLPSPSQLGMEHQQLALHG